MLDVSVLKHNWNNIFRELKERWPSLSQADIEFIGGDMDKLIKTVQRRTHVTADVAALDVHQFLEHLNVTRNIA